MSYEVRAMSIGEVLDMGFRLIRNHFGILTGIALTLTLPSALFSALVERVAEDPETLAVGGLVAMSLFLLVVSPIVSAAITKAVSEVYLGRELTYWGALRVGFGLLLPLIGTSILMGLVVMAGFILLILPGIYLIFSYMLTYQVMVIEGRAGWNALERSRNLSSGHLLRIFAIYVVAMILMMVVQGVLSLATLSIPLLGALVSGVVQAVFTAYMWATFVVIYFDLRCRKEAFDLEHLAGVVRAEPTARPVGA